jgi:hypothetical protein
MATGFKHFSQVVEKWLFPFLRCECGGRIVHRSTWEEDWYACWDCHAEMPEAAFRAAIKEKYINP